MCRSGNQRERNAIRPFNRDKCIPVNQVNRETLLSDPSEDEFIFTVNNGEHQGKLKHVYVHIADVKTPIPVTIDSGASVNILDERAFESLMQQQSSLKAEITKSEAKIFPYAARIPLQLVGVFHAKVRNSSRTVSAKFYVAKGICGSLLGVTTATQLGLLTFHVNHLNQSIYLNASNPKLTKHRSQSEVPSSSKVAKSILINNKIKIRFTRRIPRYFSKSREIKRLPAENSSRF